MKNRQIIILVVLNMVMFSIIFLQWQGYEQYMAMNVSDRKPSRVTNNNLPTKEEKQTFILPELAEFDEVLQRPLFVQSRLPPAEVKQEDVVTKKVDKLKLSLEGIALTPDKRVAILLDLQTKEHLRLAQGMEYKGWSLTDLQPDRAVFKKEKEVYEIFLEAKDDNKKIGKKFQFTLPSIGRRTSPKMNGKQ